ncbi:MAG: NINE protein [Cytophagales bacterium]
MKKLILTIVASFLMFFGANASANNSEYFLNETTVENLVAASNDMTFEYANANFSLESVAQAQSNAQLKGDKSLIVFLLLDFFLGGLAVHRFYMGVDGAWYLCLGYLFIPLPIACVDFIYALLSKDNFAKYENSKKLFVFF